MSEESFNRKDSSDIDFQFSSGGAVNSNVGEAMVEFRCVL